MLQRLAGGEHLGFNNSVFLSERESADRNYALGFFMRESKCYPEKTNLRECMDFYFQVRTYNSKPRNNYVNSQFSEEKGPGSSFHTKLYIITVYCNEKY
jgi:glutaminase